MSKQLAISISASVLAMVVMVLMQHAALPGTERSRIEAIRASADHAGAPLLRRILPALQ